jgi:putative transposase
MMVINDLRDKIPLREISGISGISLSGYYYRPVKV